MNTDFDAKAADWDADPRKQLRAAAVAAQIRERIPLDPSMQALEFGCGTGLLGFELLGDVGGMSFADPSPGMLEQVERKLERLSKEKSSSKSKGQTLLLGPDTVALPQNYDLIVSLMTLHHVALVPATLDLLTTHLNPGGVLALSDLDLEDGSFHDGQADVHLGFDRGELMLLLERRGLVDLGASTPYEIVEEKAEGPRSYPLFLITGRRPD